MGKVMVTPEIGAATHVYASFDPEIKSKSLAITPDTSSLPGACC
jgi:hypothetical protein